MVTRLPSSGAGAYAYAVTTAGEPPTKSCSCTATVRYLLKAAQPGGVVPGGSQYCGKQSFVCVSQFAAGIGAHPDGWPYPITVFPPVSL